jgi:hypothetical protein
MKSIIQQTLKHFYVHKFLLGLSPLFLFVLLLFDASTSLAIDLSVTTTPSNCPSSGRLHFSVSDLIPGSPGPGGTPPSVVFYIWSPEGKIIAGQTRLDFASAYATSDITLAGLTYGNYSIRAIESYGSQTEISSTVTAQIQDAFGVTPAFNVDVTYLHCTNVGELTANVTQGRITEFRLLDADNNSAVVVDWQTSNVFSNLAPGNYTVQGRDDCPSPTVTTRTTYTITNGNHLNNTIATLKAEPDNCSRYKFMLRVYNSNRWISNPVNVSYTIKENGITVKTGTTTFDSPDSGVELKSEKILNVFYDGYDRTKSYEFSATGTDGCDKPFNWSTVVNESANGFDLDIEKGCEWFEINHITNFVGPISWNFTTSPAGFTPITGMSEPEYLSLAGYYRIYNEDWETYPTGNYTVEFTDACGRTVTKSFTLDESTCVCDEVNNSFYVNQVQQIENCDGTTGINITFAGNGDWKSLSKAELLEAPSGYGTFSSPLDITQYLAPGAYSYNTVLLFPATVPGTYKFKFYHQGQYCDAYTQEYSVAVSEMVKFSNFKIQLAPSCNVTSINYSYSYNTTGYFGQNMVGKAALQRKSGNSWVDVADAVEFARNGTFSNIDEAGVYRVVVSKFYLDGLQGPRLLCPNEYEISNELLVTADGFPTFKDAYGLSCTENPYRKIVIVGGQSGKPWTEGYKYKVTHFNGMPYDQVSGHNVSYLSYEFRNAFNLPNGTYTFSLLDICGNEISRELDITNLDVPQVRQFNVCQNEESALTLAVDAFDNIEYQWYRQVGIKDAIGTPDDDVLVSSSNELTFSPLRISDGGLYYVRITLPITSCSVVDVPYILDLGAEPNAGNTLYPCSSQEGLSLDKQDKAPLNLKTLLSGADEGGTWAVSPSPTTGAWSGGSTFAASEAEPGTYTATYTVEGAAIGACGDVQTSSVCIKLTIFDSSLPVVLQFFTASVLTETGTNSVMLQWKTTEESNTDKFNVERSANAKDWQLVGSKHAAGESMKALSYQLKDQEPSDGINYYRIKMIDRDGTFAYSRIASVKLPESGNAAIAYPNPSTEFIQLKNVNLTNISNVEVLDIKGTAVYKSTKMLPEGISVKQFKNGIYLLKVSYKNGTHNTHKVVVSK